MIERETVVLEDNQKYIILNEKSTKNTTYLYLSKEDDEKDFCIRKLTSDKQFIIPITENEYNEALTLFGNN